MPEIAQAAQTTSLHTPPKSRWTTAPWWVMLVSSFAVVAYATRFFVVAPATGHFAQYILPLRLHIAGGMRALLAGPWQFSERLRTRALNVHRWLGRFYLLSVALGSIAGMAMAVVSMEGLGDSSRIWHSRLALVHDRAASLSHDPARRNRKASALDDSKLRPFLRRGNVTERVSPDAVRSPLVFPRFLHYCCVALLGTEPTHRRVAWAKTPGNHHEFGFRKTRKKPMNR